MFIQQLDQFIRSKLIKGVWIVTLICLVIILPVASAASAQDLVWQGNLSGNKTTTFFAEPGTGKLLFYDVKNLSGTGAGITIDVNNNGAIDQLQVTFNGEIVEARFLYEGSTVASGKQNEITCCAPFGLTILDGKLTISIGESRYTVNNVSAFQGSLTTQLLTGEVEAYK